MERALPYLAQSILGVPSFQPGALATLATQTQCLQPQAFHSTAVHALQDLAIPIPEEAYLWLDVLATQAMQELWQPARAATTTRHTHLCFANPTAIVTMSQVGALATVAMLGLC